MSDNLDNFEDSFEETGNGGVDGCKSYFLVNETLLAAGEKGDFLAWLWSPDLFLQYTPVHHVSFQACQCFLALLFLLPNSSPNRRLFRFLGLAYSGSFLIFGFFVFKSLDMMAWAGLDCLINCIYLLPTSCPRLCRSHSKELEEVYKETFQKLHVTREQFNKLLSCKKTTRVLMPKAPYAVEKITRVDSLGLLLSGRLLVSQQERPLHIIHPHQFVDSPEFFGVSTDELFQVSITALEESKILIWHRDKLRLTIMSDEFLSIMFDHIIGRDVVRKLIQVSDTVTMASGNGYCLQNQQKESSESDPMLQTTKELNVGQFGSTTLPFDSGSLSSSVCLNLFPHSGPL